jgi:predicted Zn-ribbon and HTH transcriptional regulator
MILTTDMGNGMAICEQCGYDLDHGDPSVILPKECPNCYAIFIEKV